MKARELVARTTAAMAAWKGERVPVRRGTLLLLRQVAEDAASLTECNCSYDSGTEPEDRCDGSCTHGMAVRALAQLAEEGGGR